VIQYFKGKISSYEGAFEEDKKHGEGVEVHDNGMQYTVKYWKDGIIS
jgi:MORN repeat